MLAKQEAAWNRADIDGFMAHYWNSEELLFVSSKGETTGWQAVRDRYHQAYPTPEKMGKLTFEVGKIARTGPETAEVAGRFRQDLPDGPQTGRFFLHFRRMGGHWFIVQDLTVGD